MKKKMVILVASSILLITMVTSVFLFLDNPNSLFTNNETEKNTIDNSENSTGNDNESNTGMQILDALPIYYSNSSINTNEEALEILQTYFSAIKTNTIDVLNQSGKSQYSETIKEMIFFSYYATVEKREWNNDQYWLLPNKTTYVITIPAVSTHENWVENDSSKIIVERINNSESIIQVDIPASNTESFEATKEYLEANSSNEVETFWTETNLWIKYLADENGTIYWAGQYLKSKPWLNY